MSTSSEITESYLNDLSVSPIQSSVPMSSSTNQNLKGNIGKLHYNLPKTFWEKAARTHRNNFTKKMRKYKKKGFRRDMMIQQYESDCDKLFQVSGYKNLCKKHPKFLREPFPDARSTQRKRSMSKSR